MTRLACLLLLAPLAAPAQTVEGSVVNSIDGSGIAGVQLEFQQEGRIVYTLSTDPGGHFGLENLKEGAYQVRYSHAGYWPNEPGYPLPSTGFGTYPSFQVAEGLPVKLQLHMLPNPRLSGRVLDGHGHGVANALLELSGAGQWSGPTDAQGGFDIRLGLVPGEYILSVTPPPGLKPPPRPPDDDRVRTWADTWYPGVTDEQAASPILLRPGAVVSDLVVILQAPVAHSVRGVLLNAEGKPAPDIEIHLQRGIGYSVAAGTRSKADGTFELRAVVDGNWMLSAALPNGPAGLKATTWIPMAGSDIRGLQLRLSPPFTVRGKAVIERPEGAPAPRMPLVLLAPHPGLTYDGRGGSFASGPNNQAGPDGNFTLTGVYPGLYGVYSWESEPGYYLDAIRIGEAEIAAPETEFAGPLPIAVVYKSGGGSIAGAVENCDSGRVILVPLSAPRQLPQYLRVTDCDLADHYQFRDVRPGDYYAVAVPKNLRIDFGKLDYGLLNQAGRVTVRSGEASSAGLRLAAPR